MNGSLLFASVFAPFLPLGCGDGKPDQNDRPGSPEPVDEAREDAIDEVANEVDDAVLATSVKARLAGAREFYDSDVLVSAEDGTITLSGTVPTLDQKLRATVLAHGVGGVDHVNNELLVVTEEDE